jgi:hypothetical protein
LFYKIGKQEGGKHIQSMQEIVSVGMGRWQVKKGEYRAKIVYTCT